MQAMTHHHQTQLEAASSIFCALLVSNKFSLPFIVGKEKKKKKEEKTDLPRHHFPDNLGLLPINRHCRNIDMGGLRTLYSAFQIIKEESTKELRDIAQPLKCRVTQHQTTPRLLQYGPQPAQKRGISGFLPVAP
jgi:hypothetical protein